LTLLIKNQAFVENGAECKYERMKKKEKKRKKKKPPNTKY